MESGAAKLRATQKKKDERKKLEMKKRAENWGKTPLKRFYLSKKWHGGEGVKYDEFLFNSQ